MGSTFQTCKSKSRGRKLPDGKTVGGKGRLTDSVTDSIQTYHGKAIRSNSGNVKVMQDSIWAIYYHTTRGVLMISIIIVLSVPTLGANTS